MELSVKQYLESVANPNTRKEYRIGINKFCEWFGKPAEQILEMRKDDLTQRLEENIIEFRNRAARFEKEIEKFHSHLMEQGYKTNTCRTLTLGIRQLFRYYQMPVRMRTGSRVDKTVKTTRNFPLRIEHVRRMFQVADLRERVFLSMAVDLGLRISDFIKIKRKDLSLLDGEAPIQFDVLTGKEEVIAHAFLSTETINLLKTYLPTLKKDNIYLFPSNAKSHISDEWLNRLLQKLATKAQINLNGKSLTFHCFRKMFLSASIDSGIGLTAGKKLCGKAIPKSDDTYLTTIKLREKFLQLKKFLTIIPNVNIDDVKKMEVLEEIVVNLQKELSLQKVLTETITQDLETKEQQVVDLRAFVEKRLDAQEQEKNKILTRFEKLEINQEEIRKQHPVTPKDILEELEQLDVRVRKNLDHTEEFMDKTEQKLSQFKKDLNIDK